MLVTNWIQLMIVMMTPVCRFVKTGQVVGAHMWGYAWCLDGYAWCLDVVVMLVTNWIQMMILMMKMCFGQ